MTTIDTYIRNLRGPILILGASGFIGANLYRMIAAVRSDVFAVVRYEKNWRLDSVSDEKVIMTDINDIAATKNLIDSIKPETVFDCVAYGAYSFEENITNIYETNFQSLVNLVNLLLERKVSAFIYAGSSSEYGINSNAPEETAFCEPNSHYSVSKIAAVNFLRFVGKQRGFPCVHLRLYSVYGPLEDTSRLIPNILKCALSKTLPPFVDAKTSRDFVYVDDACRAFIVAASTMNPDLHGEVFNVGTGIKTTIADLSSLVREEFDIVEEPKFGSMEGRSWDVIDWYANPQKALRLLGWKADISLREGLRKTSAWIESLSDQIYIQSTKKNLQRKQYSVTAIIACYKDVEAIPHMYRRLTDTFKKLSIDYELIFVNDGSPDNSAQVIEEISRNDSHVLGICHSRNFGSQMAFRSGMELSTMNSVVLLDGDLQDPPELIELMHSKWVEGNDVVYGRRINREMPWHWGLMYKAFYRVFAAFSYVSIPHDAGDFSLMDRRVVKWLLQCTERDLFMRGLRAYVGFKQIGVDYIRPERMFGRSTNSFIKNIEWAKRGIFSFSNTPLTILTAGGLIAFLISSLLAIAVALLKVFLPEIAPRGVTTLLITTLLLGSINLFAIGIVGEYIAKILIEVKGRPRLIRSALIRHGKLTELLPDGKVNSP
jgi:nucleoside-diphosphate-sugar epimerase/glycosyltransferase involved in cell wall biosynthesis